MRIKLNFAGGNWETIAFIIIKKILIGKDPYFMWSELMTMEHLDFAVQLTEFLGHKKNPQYPDKTLQRTIQNLRDKGFIRFLGQGDYKLTASGHNKMERLAGKFPYHTLKKALEG